jgi:hypothetical protein
MRLRSVPTSPGGAGDIFRALWRLAGDQHGLAHCGCLLLDAAGLGQDDLGADHQVDKRHVIQRVQQENAGLTSLDLPHQPAHFWIGMDGVDNLHVTACGDVQNGLAHAIDAALEILPTMAGHQDQAFGPVEKIELWFESGREITIALQTPPKVEQRVDHVVAGDLDRRGNAFLQ